MKWILGTLGLLVLGLILKLSLLVYAMYVLLGILGLSRFFPGPGSTISWPAGL